VVRTEGSKVVADASQGGPDKVLLAADDRIRMSLGQYEAFQRAFSLLRSHALTSESIIRVDMIGSVARRTALREGSDLDVAIFLRPDIALGVAPSEILAALARYFEPVYDSIGIGSRILTVKAAQDIAIDLLPMYSPSASAVFTASEYSNEWVKNPLLEADHFIRTCYQSYGDGLPRIVRLLKAWNQRLSVGFLSVELELLTVTADWEKEPVIPFMESFRRVVGRVLGWLDGRVDVDLVGTRVCRSAEMLHKMISAAETLHSLVTAMSMGTGENRHAASRAWTELFR
jgi:predicted nucleotidyltransferase